MKENRVLMFVHPKFKNKTKILAAQEGKSMIEYTKDITEFMENLREDFRPKRRIKFDFP